MLLTSPTSNLLIYSTIEGPDINDTILNQCADLFSNNYGIWGQRPANTKGPKPGSRVKATVTFLRQQFLTDLNNTVLVVCYQRNPHDVTRWELIGHAFATAWDYENGRVGWVTQLVVDARHRNRYIATSLLQMLKQTSSFNDIKAIGLVSSHPAACHALAKYISAPIESIDTRFCRDNASSIMMSSPIKYLQDAKLHGSLFEENCTSGAVSSVFTNFYIDHAEPLAALSTYKARRRWVLGELLDGHEFLIIVPVRASTGPVCGPA